MFIMENELVKETDAIKEKTVSVKLSASDCQKISELCGKHGITVGKLLENFIYDLTGGARSNGSDERECAKSYFNRCWSYLSDEKTLLNFLLERDEYDVEEFVDLIDLIHAEYDVLDYSEKNPGKFDAAEIQDIKAVIECAEEELGEIKSKYFCVNSDADWEEEVVKVQRWLTETERLRDE